MKRADKALLAAWTISLCLSIGAAASLPYQAVKKPKAAATQTPLFAVHAGGPAYIDFTGVQWAADKNFTGGFIYAPVPAPVIAKTADQPLYQTERYGSFSYTFPVPNGTYNVVLKFAEIYFSAAKSRIFGVTINGTSVLSNFDVVAVGGVKTAVDNSFPVMVVNGSVVVAFVPGSVDSPKVSAIEILPVGVIPPPPPAIAQVCGTLVSGVAGCFDASKPINYTAAIGVGSVTLIGSLTINNPPPPPPPLAITSVAPTSGQVGTPITLTGTGFVPGSTVVIGPTGGTVIPATNVVVTSSTTITAAIPVGLANGPVDITVTTPRGAAARLRLGQKGVTK